MSAPPGKGVPQPEFVGNPEFQTGPKETNRVAAGLKASMANDRVYDEGKAQAEDKLQRLEKGQDVANEEPAGTGSGSNEIGGHKAAIKNPNTGAEARENSKQYLEEHGAMTDEYK
ncbi:hypothetical protein BDV98DRAFT_600904 [Pterulicium gracile]|uniref:Conidiation protein 6-domain-containing protein n=1 Tax=Pterulicium gracile TaxID=1884261 RepID=A0A5C3R3V5_9AGAR|nr:hypothetical protein BDV98DRAFT_600904 [Pterula gracilis]